MNSASSTLGAASARMAVTMRIARLVRSAVIELFHVRLLPLAGPSVLMRGVGFFLRWSQPNFFRSIRYRKLGERNDRSTCQ